MRHQDWHRHLLQDGTRDTAEDEFPRARMAIAAITIRSQPSSAARESISAACSRCKQWTRRLIWINRPIARDQRCERRAGAAGALASATKVNRASEPAATTASPRRRQRSCRPRSRQRAGRSERVEEHDEQHQYERGDRDAPARLGDGHGALSKAQRPSHRLRPVFCNARRSNFARNPLITG